MADKQQNIFINYKFPMAEAEKASVTLNRINQTNNLVQQSAQKTGQAIGNAFKGANNSIAFMNTQLARLKTQIEISSNPKRVAELSNQYKVLKAQIDAANKSAFETPKAIKATTAATQSMSQQFGQLYQAMKLVVTAGVLREVVDIGLEMAKLKGNVEGVERAFDRAFPNQVKILNDLREATHGTVSDFELMQRTLQATNLGVAVEQLPILFEFAAARAQQTGESVDYLVDSIVRGIGRKSLLVLDNLGLSATRLKEQFGGAALASQSVADVTRGVAEIARVELEKMGGYAETSATQVDQLKTSWEELRITLAKKIESGGVISFLDSAVDGLRDFIKGNKEVSEEFLRSIGAEQAARFKESQAFKEAGNDRQKQFDAIQQEINTRTELAVEIKGSIADKVRERQAIIENRFLTHAETDAYNTQIGVLNQRQFVQAAAILALKEYRDELEKVQEIVAEPSGIIERKKAEIAAIQEQIEKTNELSDLGVGGKLTKALEIAQAELGDLQRAFSDIDPIKFIFEIDKATEGLNRFIKAGEKLNAPQMKQRFEVALEGLAAAIPEALPEIAVPTSWDIFLEDMANTWEEFRQEVAVTGVDILADQLIASEQLELDSMKNRLRGLKNFYDEQQLLAGDNEKAKQILRLREERETTKLQRQIFEKEKQTRRSQALIDGAAGVVKAFATYPYPAALIISGLIAAQTLSQIRIINRQKPGFAKGVIDLQGPGTSTSDSIPANLSKHESVMTAWETNHAGDVLRDIRAKKLDNKVLKDLKQGRAPIQQQFNDERIIKAIEKNRPPDVIEQSGIVYKATQKSDTYLNKIRAKSVRL